MQTDPTAPAVTATEPAVTADPADTGTPVTSETSDTALAVPVVTPATDPADTVPAVGTVYLFRSRYGSVDGTETPVPYVVTSVSLGHTSGRWVTAYAIGTDGQHATIWPADITAGRWQMDTAVGSGTTALLGMLWSQLLDARRARIDADQALETFKDEVRDVAMRYAREHDWCAVVASALSDLGISASRRVTVSGTFSVTMDLEYGTDTPDASDVLSELESYDLSVDDVEDCE